MRDMSEHLDEYCYEKYGHTNWGYKDTYSKEELQNKDYDQEDNIIFWHHEDEEDE